MAVRAALQKANAAPLFDGAEFDRRYAQGLTMAAALVNLIVLVAIIAEWAYGAEMRTMALTLLGVPASSGMSRYARELARSGQR